MPRVTILSDTDEKYDIEDENIFIHDGSVHTSIRFPNKSLLPDELDNIPASRIIGWDIVATDDETVSGSIYNASGLEIKFRQDDP